MATWGRIKREEAQGDWERIRQVDSIMAWVSHSKQSRQGSLTGEWGIHFQAGGTDNVEADHPFTDLGGQVTDIWEVGQMMGFGAGMAIPGEVGRGMVTSKIKESSVTRDSIEEGEELQIRQDVV